MLHEGGCACGRIRYRVEGAPNNTTNCHCSQCRLASGAPYLTLSEFPAANVQFVTEKPHYYKSSNKAERGFCPSCGSTLCFHYFGSETLDIATATFDDPALFPPQDHLWTESKVPWLVIGDDLPQFRHGRNEN